MPRYFFTLLRDFNSLADDQGEELPSVEDAKALASRIARELAADVDNWRGYHVVVSDEQGDEVTRVPVST